MLLNSPLAEGDYRLFPIFRLPSIHPPIHLSVHPSARPRTHPLFHHPPTHPPTHPTIHLSIHSSSTHPSTHPSTTSTQPSSVHSPVHPLICHLSILPSTDSPLFLPAPTILKGHLRVQAAPTPVRGSLCACKAFLPPPGTCSNAEGPSSLL